MRGEEGQEVGGPCGLLGVRAEVGKYFGDPIDQGVGVEMLAEPGEGEIHLIG